MNPIDKAYEMTKKADPSSLLSSAGRFVGGLGRGLAGEGPRLLSGQAGQGMGQAIRAGAGAAAGSAAIAGLGVAAKKIWDSIESRRVYKEMTQLNPQLAEARDQNPMMFNAAYNSLRRLNPMFAGDPFVAGHVMSGVMSASNPMEAAGKIMGSVRPPEVPKREMSLQLNSPPLRFNQPL
jgi:hypothetical protein